jgi:hypothetical protein
VKRGKDTAGTFRRVFRIFQKFHLPLSNLSYIVPWFCKGCQWSYSTKCPYGNDEHSSCTDNAGSPARIAKSGKNPAVLPSVLPDIVKKGLEIPSKTMLK